jgi:hypothetical protein
MPDMAIQTRPTGADVTAFLEAVVDPTRRADALRFRSLVERVTGAQAEMWGPAIVGFGSKQVVGKSGTSEWMRLGFSPRAASLTIYGVFSVSRPDDPLFAQLGPHTTAKGCLYLKRLDAVDESVLEQLVREAFAREE